MKAVIMAGGEGSRLRPLTCDIPKPMARLCGRPVMEYILDLLKKHGCEKAAVTTRYLPDVITEHFPDNAYSDVELEFALENTPLGTAGSVKNACISEAFKNENEILVISGDAMCDFDLTQAIEYHRFSQADATIMAKRVSDPREYGLIDIQNDGRIAAFIEKPAFSQAISDLANTGIYILSKKAIDLIPEDTFFDFAKDLFPMMLGDGMKLMCWEGEGYWCDIGDLESYITCQQDMLMGLVDCKIHAVTDENGNYFAGSLPPRSCVITPPVYIGRDVSIDDGAVIESSVIDNGCHIGESARVSGSVILQCAYISGRSRLTGALVCAGGSIKTGAMLFEGATIGAGAVIGERASVAAGVKVWNRKVIPSAANVQEHVKLSAPQRGFFGEDGIGGEISVELTPEYLARIGCAIGSFKPDSRIAVGCSAHTGVSVLKDALAAGIQSTGAGVMDFGEGFKAMFEFNMNFSSAPLGVYVNGGSRSGVRVLSAGGLPADRGTERGIEGILAGGEFVRKSYDGMGDKVGMSGMEMLYKSHLIRFAPKGLSGCSAKVRSRGMMAQAILRDTFYKLGCDIGDGFTIELSSQGDKVRIYDDNLGYIPHHVILAWCALSEMEKGEDVALPFDAPRFLDGAAEENGVRLHRYFDCPADNSDAEARKIAAFQMWSRDGLMQAVMLLSIVKREGGLENLMRRYPGFGMSVRSLDTVSNPAWLIRGINPHDSSTVAEGVVLNSERGIVLVKPLKRGNGLRILAEAANSETAEEICADVERMLVDRIKAQDE